MISTLFLQACDDGTQKVRTVVSQRTKSRGPKPADHMFVGGKIKGPFVPGAAPSHMPVHVGAGPMVAAGQLSLMSCRPRNATCQHPGGQAGWCLLLRRSKCQGHIRSSGSPHCSEHLRLVTRQSVHSPGGAGPTRGSGLSHCTLSSCSHLSQKCTCMAEGS